MRCTKCRQKVYCSKACQVAGWKGGHKQECKRLREGGEGGGGSGVAALQDALRAALLGTTVGAAMDRLEQVFGKMTKAFNAEKWAEVVEMAEEGQAMAGEVRRARPGAAALIYWMLGASFVERFEQVKGVGLLEQARALAVESGDRSLLGKACNSLGNLHQVQGEHEKAIEVYEQARASLVELGDRRSEGIACSNLGACYRMLKEYDKAIELFLQSLAIKEVFGERLGIARTCLSLGICLSWQGQHNRAVNCLEHAWDVSQEHGDESDQARAALHLGEALWVRARAQHHQAPSDTTSCDGVSAASADTLQKAETWLGTALDLAVKTRSLTFQLDALMHLAYVAMMKGDEDEAVELLSLYLQGWVDKGPTICAGCFQVRGEDAPMLSCDGCRVARCVYAATPVPCGRNWHARRGLADREAWMDEAGTAMLITSGWRGRARLGTTAMASRTRASARC